MRGEGLGCQVLESKALKNWAGEEGESTGGVLHLVTFTRLEVQPWREWVSEWFELRKQVRRMVLLISETKFALCLLLLLDSCCSSSYHEQKCKSVVGMWANKSLTLTHSLTVPCEWACGHVCTHIYLHPPPNHAGDDDDPLEAYILSGSWSPSELLSSSGSVLQKHSHKAAHWTPSLDEREMAVHLHTVDKLLG